MLHTNLNTNIYLGIRCSHLSLIFPLCLSFSRTLDRSNVSYESIFRWRIYDIWLGCDRLYGDRSGRSHGSDDLHISQNDQMYIF